MPPGCIKPILWNKAGRKGWDISETANKYDNMLAGITELLSYGTLEERLRQWMHRVREARDNELLKQCDTEEGESVGGGRQTAFINSICLCCVNGCDCVTFAGSNPAPSFWLIMQGPIKIQGDACHQQRFNNKWSPATSETWCPVGVSAEQKWTAWQEGKTEKSW